MIVPFCVFLGILEFFKIPKENPNMGEIIKRAVVSMILLFSFDETINILAIVGDGITGKIDGITKLWDLLGHLEFNFKDSSASWFKFREAVIFILGLLSYIVAYVGIFVANALIHFVWSILYVCSPLMILMYVSEKTSFVTKNLYKGLINVMVWKILWSILGVFLLKFASAPMAGDWDNFLTAILINLFIGTSMLLIPFATKSLINDGLSSAATVLAATPTVGTANMIKGFTKSQGRKISSTTLNGTKRGLGMAMKAANRNFKPLSFRNFKRKDISRPPLNNKEPNDEKDIKSK